MLDVRFVPLSIEKFPGGARKVRRPSTVFSSTYQRTLDRLESELQKLRAIDVVIQAGYQIPDIRNDGWPRSSAKPVHPAVVLSFRSRDAKQEYSFPCDTFQHFEHNLHAIAFTLEALRAVNRYGVTRGHEQYKGFAQIEAPPDPARWTVDAAALWLKSWLPGSDPLSSASQYRDAYRAAARRLHPDATAVETPDWQRLQEAKSLLDEHHRISGAEVSA